MWAFTINNRATMEVYLNLNAVDKVQHLSLS